MENCAPDSNITPRKNEIINFAFAITDRIVVTGITPWNDEHTGDNKITPRENETLNFTNGIRKPKSKQIVTGITPRKNEIGIPIENGIANHCSTKK